MAGFAGVGIQPAHQNTWFFDGEFVFEIAMQNGQDLSQAVLSDRGSNPMQRQMGSGQRNSQALCGKHHDREVNFTLLREKFRVTGKGMPASLMTPLCTGPVTSA